MQKKRNSIAIGCISFALSHQYDIDGLVQDCSNSIANALELLQSCTKPSIYCIQAIFLGHNELKKHI